MRTASLSYPPSTEQQRHKYHSRLNSFNHTRLMPAQLQPHWEADLKAELGMRVAEGKFIEAERKRIHRTAEDAPDQPAAFLHWFEQLREHGSGQGDPLFAWLADTASLEQMRWFLSQEAAGEAGFEDLVALTQVRFPVRAKLEMARNFWDEMGRGHERGMHGLMLAAVVRVLELKPTIETTVWQTLALSNLMAGLCSNRRYAYQAIGALGAIEMTAPGRVAQVEAGLRRLDVPAAARTYFQLHAGLDIRHSQAWNEEVLYTLVRSDPGTAQPIAEGAMMRLACGEACFRRYRTHFGLDES